MLRLQTKHERAMSEPLLLAALGAVACGIGIICGYILGSRDTHDFSDDPPRPSLARDVRTPGSKLVAMPRVVKPSSAWPRVADGVGPREPVQRVQSQVERGDAA